MYNYEEIIADDMSASGVTGLMIFYLLYLLIMLAVSVGTYVFQSLSLYTISKRRGIRHPGLAWIPVGNTWILGCISDQFQYVVKGKTRNKRKALLVLNILMYIALIVVFVLYFVVLFSMFDFNSYYGDEVSMNFGALFGMLFALLVMAGVSIAVTVIQYIALYDLYTSCDPENNVMYLVLGIFVSITQPIFLFICRNKDLGMPPRKPEPSAHIPQQPAWKPSQPPVEPWENQDPEE